MPPPGGHPLGVALADHAAAAIGVVVRDLAVEDVAHGLEAAVRVPRRALRLPGGVDLRPEVVEQQERVRLGHRQAAREGPTDAEPGALELAVRGDDLGNRARRGRGRVGSGDAGKDEGVVDGDGRHRNQLPFSGEL